MGAGGLQHLGSIFGYDINQLYDIYLSMQFLVFSSLKWDYQYLPHWAVLQNEQNHISAGT